MDLIVTSFFSWSIQVFFYINSRDTQMKPWKVNGKVAGFNKIVGNLELRTINDAGHLVPMDQGEWAL